MKHCWPQKICHVILFDWIFIKIIVDSLQSNRYPPLLSFLIGHVDKIIVFHTRMCILIKSTDLIHMSLGLLILSYVGISVHQSEDIYSGFHIFL